MAKFTPEEVSSLQRGGNEVMYICMFHLLYGLCTLIFLNNFFTALADSLFLYHSAQGKFILKSGTHNVNLLLIAGFLSYAMCFNFRNLING